jgi:hypothetical protein
MAPPSGRSPGRPGATPRGPPPRPAPGRSPRGSGCHPSQPLYRSTAFRFDSSVAAHTSPRTPPYPGPKPPLPTWVYRRRTKGVGGSRATPRSPRPPLRPAGRTTPRTGARPSRPAGATAGTALLPSRYPCECTVTRLRWAAAAPLNRGLFRAGGWAATAPTTVILPAPGATAKAAGAIADSTAYRGLELRGVMGARCLFDSRTNPRRKRGSCPRFRLGLVSCFLAG